MKFIHEETGLKIKFSLKEKIRILLKRHIKFNAKSSHDFSVNLLHLISTTLEKYGDSRKHGNIVPQDTKP